MAISTQTEALIDFYNQKIYLDTQQITQITQLENGYIIESGIGTKPLKIYGPDELISNYNHSISPLDSEIVSINTEIQNLQNLVLSIGQEANSVGCGTTAWAVGFTTVTVLQDNARYRGYSYTTPNPFSGINGGLNISNPGIGTQTFINQVSIGTYFSPINTCLDLLQITCNSTICSGYATSISNLQSQINTLQTERDNLINKVNILKQSRISPELQRYSYTESKNKINTQIGISSSIIQFLSDPANDQWL